MDVVINNLDGSPMLLKNKGVPGRHWVSFELAGTKSNRLALNARVKVVAGGMTQTDEVHSGGSYLSQNDLRIDSGLGGHQQLDKAEVLWPVGRMETLTNLATDHFYPVREGAGTGISPLSPFQGRSQPMASLPAITWQPARRAPPQLDEVS